MNVETDKGLGGWQWHWERSTSLYYISLYLGWEIYRWSTQKYKYEWQRSSSWAINYWERTLSWNLTMNLVGDKHQLENIVVSRNFLFHDLYWAFWTLSVSLTPKLQDPWLAPAALVCIRAALAHFISTWCNLYQLYINLMQPISTLYQPDPLSFILFPCTLLFPVSLLSW